MRYIVVNIYDLETSVCILYKFTDSIYDKKCIRLQKINFLCVFVLFKEF